MLVNSIGKPSAPKILQLIVKMREPGTARRTEQPNHIPGSDPIASLQPHRTKMHPSMHGNIFHADVQVLQRPNLRLAEA
jgi:hypothetical protein